jgi:hypothetical protein
MILPWKPKPGAAIGKPGYVQQIGELGPPDFNMSDYVKDGINMAAQRLIDGVRSGDTESVVSALRNLYALMETEEDTSEED